MVDHRFAVEVGVECLARLVGEPNVGDIDRRSSDVGLDAHVDRLAVGRDDVDDRQFLVPSSFRTGSCSPACHSTIAV